jgi:radical SAM protein with 4Fe4S-binding SPASM domain
MSLKWINFFLEELKFFKSFEDIKIFYVQKLPFFWARVAPNLFVNSRMPLSLQIEPTNYCNLNCMCCPVDRMQRKRGYMDFDLFNKIIDEASAIGVKRIHFFLHGEPMLHPRIIDMIRKIKTNGMGMSMHTNGMLFSREEIRDILNSGVNSGDYFIFSILGFSKEVHQKIMRGVNHDRVIKNVLEFLALRKQQKVNGPIVDVIFYGMPENCSEEAQFVEYWRDIVDHVHIAKEISTSFAKYKTGPKSIPVRKRTCKNLWERMTIYWNGDVSICCEDLDGDYVLGNLREKSIKEIWNGDKLLSIKKSHKENNFEKLALCSKCDW